MKFEEYLDITPLILLVGVVFVVVRFVALGTGNPALYIPEWFSWRFVYGRILRCGDRFRKRTGKSAND